MSPTSIPTLPAPSLAGVAGLYCTGEESLRVTSLNGVAAVTLALGARFLQLGADHPIAQQFAHTPNTDRSARTTDHKLGEGWLQGLTLVADSGSPPFGGCYVRVDLVRGAGTAVTVLDTLLQGYVTGSQRRTSPGSVVESAVAGPGRIRVITGTDPAAGAEISETVPTGARWLLRALRAALVTDATVANREVALTIDDGAAIYFESHSGANQTASLTRQYTATRAGVRGAAATGTGILIATSPVIALAGHRIRTATTNLQAGDNWGAPVYQVEEWIEAA